MVPAAGLDDVGTDREVLDSYHYVSPRRQSQANGHHIFRDAPNRLSAQAVIPGISLDFQALSRGRLAGGCPQVRNRT